MRRAAIALVVIGVLVAPTAAAAAYRFPGDAPFSVSKQKMRDAFDCKGRDGLHRSPRGQPVLLVHGTGITRKQNWGWNYWNALPAEGFETCWVSLPKAALGDIQVASEYVAFAYGFMHRRTDQKVDVIAHSQGGLEARWAIKWFANGRFVDDYVALATPNHGTVVADGLTQTGGCAPACWQMRTTAKFIAALNRDTESPGRISYTSIYSSFDELVQPPESARIDGARNILIQDICPGRPVDHVAIAGDAVTYRLVLDALTHRGPADPARLPATVCDEDAMPGASDPPPETARLADWQRGELTDHEPRLKRYARR